MKKNVLLDAILQGCEVSALRFEECQNPQGKLASSVCRMLAHEIKSAYVRNAGIPKLKRKR